MDQQRHLNIWFLLVILIVQMSQNICQANTYFEIPAALANQMLNLKKGYRYQFVKECIQGKCDFLDIVDIDKRYWKSETLKETGRSLCQNNKVQQQLGCSILMGQHM
ncbi:uncharacterized protein LOC144434813 [Glandiceps talaboti]